jgi:hypothetical protein
MNEEKTTDINISLVMRQTNYDKETAHQKLIEHNNNVMNIIREYMIDPSKIAAPATKLSTNQQIYKEIRGMMDDAAKTYELNKVK